MNSNFKLLNKTKILINDINKLLPNYPNKEVVLKNNIEKNMYDLIRCIFAYNINNVDRIKEKYAKDFVLELAMFDYYMEVSYRKKIITQKKFASIITMVTEIRRIAYGIIRKELNKVNETN